LTDPGPPQEQERRSPPRRPATGGGDARERRLQSRGGPGDIPSSGEWLQGGGGQWIQGGGGRPVLALDISQRLKLDHSGGATPATPAVGAPARSCAPLTSGGVGISDIS
jgi:hypothetical protein